jgi:hypothetical protein
MQYGGDVTVKSTLSDGSLRNKSMQSPRCKIIFRLGPKRRYIFAAGITSLGSNNFRRWSTPALANFRYAFSVFEFASEKSAFIRD